MQENSFSTFSLLPSYLESKNQKELEINLERALLGKKTLDTILSFDSKFYSEDDEKKLEKLIPLLHKHEGVPGFNSMLLENIEKLYEEVSKIYSLSKSHYLWAKKINLRGTFPRNCCNISSFNLLLSFLSYGYSNVTRLPNEKHNHTYLLFPFVLEDSIGRGFIVLDPTSDQVIHFGNKSPSNYMKIISGGDSLESEGILYSNLDCLRIDGVKSRKGFDYYSKKVFENPIRLKNNKIKY